MEIWLRGKTILIINVYPYKTFRERIRLMKEVKGTISVENGYIVATETIRGQK